MAEPFAIAQGAITLAGTGITIAKALKDYIDTVRTAQKKLRPVVRDVEVMSGVLTQIGTALENGEIRKLRTTQFFGIAKGALESCEENFQLLKSFNTGLIQIDGNEIRMKTSAKLILYFKQQDLDTLRGNMGESKASLNLVIGTLQVVITMRTAPKHSAAVEDLMRNMQHRLIDLEKEKQRATNPSIPSVDKAIPRIDGLASVDTEPPKNAKATGEREKDVQPDVSGGEASRSLCDASRDTPSARNIDNLKDTNVANPPATRHVLAVLNTTAPSFSTSTPAERADSIQSQTQVPQTATSQGLTSEPKRRDQLLIHLEDASRASSELRFETLDLIDMCQMGRTYYSKRLRSKYGQAQHAFDKIWTQEKWDLESGSLARTKDPPQVPILEDSPTEGSSNEAVAISESSLEDASRPLSSTEAWSMYNFENHARQCVECYNPLQVHQKGNRLCDTGHALAGDVARYVYYKAGEVYTQKSDHLRAVRVDLPPNYIQTRDLLRAQDRAMRIIRTAPIISYDPTFAVTPKRSLPIKRRGESYSSQDPKESLHIEPRHTEIDGKRRLRRTHKSKRHDTVVVVDDVIAESAYQTDKKSDSRRGSLYDTDIQRSKKDQGYLVEIRPPEARRYRWSKRYTEANYSERSSPQPGEYDKDNIEVGRARQAGRWSSDDLPASASLVPPIQEDDYEFERQQSRSTRSQGAQQASAVYLSRDMMQDGMQSQRSDSRSLSSPVPYPHLGDSSPLRYGRQQLDAELAQGIMGLARENQQQRHRTNEDDFDGRSESPSVKSDAPEAMAAVEELLRNWTTLDV